MVDKSLDNLPIMYSFKRCPYAIRARIAMAYSRQSYILREVDLKSKPQELVDLSPKATVPVLHLDNDIVLEESKDIVLWALDKSLPSHWLANDKAMNDSDASRMFNLLHSDFVKSLRVVKYPDRYKDKDVNIEDHKIILKEYLEDLNVLIASKGFICEKQSAMDLLFFPLIRQLYLVDEQWFEVNVPGELKLWLDFWFNEPEYINSMGSYKVWNNADVGQIIEFV